jgi:hypothetical protein
MQGLLFSQKSEWRLQLRQGSFVLSARVRLLAVSTASSSPTTGELNIDGSSRDLIGTQY